MSDWEPLDWLSKHGKPVTYADGYPDFFRAFLDRAADQDIWWTCTVEEGNWTIRLRPALMPTMRASDLGLAP